ncbi:TPA: oligosaccharide flippase family protein [Clostridium perfringens]
MNKKKNLISNYIYNMMFSILNLLFPLITLPYVSRIIGVDGIGKVNFANSIVNYFLMVASLGIPLYGVREIAKVRNDKKRLSNTFSEIFTINLISTIFCITIYYLMVYNIGYFKNDRVLFYVSGISLLLNILNIDWFFQGLEEYRFITIRSSIVKLISIVLLFLFVKNKNDYIVYALINVIAISGNNIINVINMTNITKISFKNLNIKSRIAPITVLLSIQLAISIYANLDTTMCGILANDASVGFYSNAVKINRVIVTLVISISTILLPRLSFYVENNDMLNFEKIVNLVLNVILFIGIPAMIGSILLSKEIIMVMFGVEFIPSITTMRILSPLIVILSIGNLFGTQILIPLGKEKKLLVAVLSGSIINFTLNVMLIPIYKENGAAFATIIAEFIIMIIQVYFATKQVEVSLSLKEIIKMVISNMIMIIVLICIKSVIKNEFLSLIISVILGGSIYLISNLIMKSYIMIEIMKKLKLIK